MKTLSRALALCLALCLFALAMPAATMAKGAAEEERQTLNSGDFTFALLEDGTAEIIRYWGKAAELAVPAKLEGRAVTSIGNRAFYDCSSLTAITLPDSLMTVGANSFKDCDALQAIRVSPDHPTLATIDGVLFSKPDKRLICYPCALTAQTYAVPQGILSIGDWAFSDCKSLTAITLPDSLTEIGDGAFSDCKSLTAITLPDSLTEIGDRAFYECDNLTLTVARDSYAQKYCAENGLNYTYPDANDWLNN